MRGASYSPLIAAALLPTACSEPRATSGEEARSALSACGIAESELVWLVDDQGSFLFGRPAQDSPALDEAKSDCLKRWLDKENVRTGAIGYEVAS